MIGTGRHSKLSVILRWNNTLVTVENWKKLLFMEILFLAFSHVFGTVDHESDANFELQWQIRSEKPFYFRGTHERKPGSG